MVYVCFYNSIKIKVFFIICEGFSKFDNYVCYVVQKFHARCLRTKICEETYLVQQPYLEKLNDLLFSLIQRFLKWFKFEVYGIFVFLKPLSKWNLFINIKFNPLLVELTSYKRTFKGLIIFMDLYV